MKHKRYFSSSLKSYYQVGILLLFGLVLNSLLVSHQPPTDFSASKLESALSEQIQQQPDEMLKVIVQQEHVENDLEAQVSDLGGTVTTELPIINGFAAEMSGQAVLSLADLPSVKHISLDGLVTGAQGGWQTIDIRINNYADDVEERLSDGNMYRHSSDLEIGDDLAYTGAQTVGLRFNDIQIPHGATISNAYIEFESDETDSGLTSVLITGQFADNAPPFTTANYDLSNRTRTSATVAWNNIVPWSTTSQKHQTPDLANIVQEIVNLGGWTAGNSLVFIIDGTGTRTAEAYDGESANAPLLHVEFSDSQGTPSTSLPPDEWSCDTERNYIPVTMRIEDPLSREKLLKQVYTDCEENDYNIYDSLEIQPTSAKMPWRIYDSQSQSLLVELTAHAAADATLKLASADASALGDTPPSPTGGGDDRNDFARMVEWHQWNKYL